MKNETQQILIITIGFVLFVLIIIGMIVHINDSNNNKCVYQFKCYNSLDNKTCKINMHVDNITIVQEITQFSEVCIKS